MRKRKLQIGPTLSKHSIQHGLGTYHITSSEELEKHTCNGPNILRPFA